MVRTLRLRCDKVPNRSMLLKLIRGSVSLEYDYIRNIRIRIPAFIRSWAMAVPFFITPSTSTT